MMEKAKARREEAEARIEAIRKKRMAAMEEPEPEAVAPAKKPKAKPSKAEPEPEDLAPAKKPKTKASKTSPKAEDAVPAAKPAGKSDAVATKAKPVPAPAKDADARDASEIPDPGDDGRVRPLSLGQASSMKTAIAAQEQRLKEQLALQRSLEKQLLEAQERNDENAVERIGARLAAVRATARSYATAIEMMRKQEERTQKALEIRF